MLLEAEAASKAEAGASLQGKQMLEMIQLLLLREPKESVAVNDEDVESLDDLL